MHIPDIRRVGIIFSGGPAPGANAVISAAATSFIDDGREVLGFFHGYSHLQEYHPVTHRLLPDKHYRMLLEEHVVGMRNTRGILLGTARANPGKGITSREDLKDPVKTKALSNVYSALVDLQVDALISIGGDDTLKTANFLYEYQKGLPPEAKRVSVIHLPKTIDNDYEGIDFTFGFFTAVDVMGKELQNLRADAISTGSYFIVETMGRKAGWLSYGVAIAGEANLVVGVEDLPNYADKDGKLDVKRLADHIVELVIHRERTNKGYGTIVIAEGLSEHLPAKMLEGISRDPHGHISLGRMNLGSAIADMVKERLLARGVDKKFTGVQLGYESRCAPPHAFDVMLGSQLGIGAYRALVEQGVDGHMVSVSGQLDLCYVPFAQLVDPVTMVTQVRYIDRKSDFHKLARFLENRTERLREFAPPNQGDK